MEPADTPPMSGSNSICVSTVLLETGIVPMQEPETGWCWKRQAGSWRSPRLPRRQGRAHHRPNVLSFRGQARRNARSGGRGHPHRGHGLWRRQFVIADAHVLGFADLAGRSPRTGGNRHQDHPCRQSSRSVWHLRPNPDWDHISFCQIAALPVEERRASCTGSNAVVIRPGKVDRSPTGTGCSARMAVLHAKGRMRVGDRYTAHSIIGSTFRCHLDAETMLRSTILA